MNDTYKILDKKIYITVNELNIDLYGGIRLPITHKALNDIDIYYGDIVNLSSSIFTQDLSLPFVKDYNYLDSGVAAISGRDEKGEVSLLISGGQFIITYNIASYYFDNLGQKQIKLNDNITYPLEFVVSLKEKEGYKKTYQIYEYIYDARSNDREDYFSDEIFANFRSVNTANFKKNILFRAGSPINDKYNRNKYVDKLAAREGINTFINLADSPKSIASYYSKEDYLNSYYITKKDSTLLLGLPADYSSLIFIKGICDAFRYILTHKPPYLIHCIEGKDRTGFIVAILEALLGASTEEIYKDYLLTFINYFSINPKDELASFIGMKIFDYLSTAFNVDAFKCDNLSLAARNYLIKIGLKGKEIDDLVSLLGE